MGTSEGVEPSAGSGTEAELEKQAELAPSQGSLLGSIPVLTTSERLVTQPGVATGSGLVTWAGLGTMAELGTSAEMPPLLWLDK